MFNEIQSFFGLNRKYGAISKGEDFSARDAETPNRIARKAVMAQRPAVYAKVEAPAAETRYRESLLVRRRRRHTRLSNRH